MSPSHHAVIFDCDGTLLRSLGMEAYNSALAKVGARPHAPEEIKRFFGTSSDKIFRKLLGDEARAREAYEHFFEIESGQVSKIVLHAGVRELLENLKRSGVKLAVVTGRHSREVKALFNHHDLFGYFGTVIGDNLLSRPKPVAALWDEWVKPEEMAAHAPALMARTPAEIWDWTRETIL